MHMLYRVYLAHASQLCEVVAIANTYPADEESEARDTEDLPKATWFCSSRFRIWLLWLLKKIRQTITGLISTRLYAFPRSMLGVTNSEGGWVISMSAAGWAATVEALEFSDIIYWGSPLPHSSELWPWRTYVLTVARRTDFKKISRRDWNMDI